MRALVLMCLAAVVVPPAAAVEVRAAIDHSEWDRLLRRWVDDRGLVDYAGWKASPDRKALGSYVDALAAEAQPPARDQEKVAALINAYNALTISWILDNYPTASIRSLDDSFGGARHRVGGARVSLDDIEHKTLRPVAGYRVHAVLVCAARSCPPLAREAYRTDRLESQLDSAMERWLAREDLNRFDPEKKTASVSSLFKWFAEDFERAGGVAKVLERHGPPAAKGVVQHKDAKIDHVDYDWSLNDQGRKHEYGRLRRMWDAFKDRF